MVVAAARSPFCFGAIATISFLVTIRFGGTDLLKATGTVIVLAVSAIAGSIWANAPARRAEKQERQLYFEISCVVLRSLVHIIVFLYQDSLPKVFTLIAIFILPMLPAVDDPKPFCVLLYLFFHLIVAFLQFKSDFWGEGWQWLTVLVFYYGVLLDGTFGRGPPAGTDKDIQTPLFKALRSLVSMVCDGYVLLDTEGSIKGMDRKMETFLELQGPDAATPGNFETFMEVSKSSSEPSSSNKTAAGLRTMTVRTSLGQKYEVEAYTVACPRGICLSDGMDLLLGRATSSKEKMDHTSEGYQGQLFIRAIRVLQHFENQQPSSSHMSRERSKDRHEKRGMSKGDLRDLGGGRGDLQPASGDLASLGMGGLGGTVGGSRMPAGPMQLGGTRRPGSSPDVLRDSLAHSLGSQSRSIGDMPGSDGPKKHDLMPQTVEPGDQQSDLSAATAPQSLVSDKQEAEPVVQKGQEQAFPAGPWRSMHLVGLGVGEYTKVRTIAKGSQGVVWEVRSHHGDKLAMKEVGLPGLIWQRDFPRLLQSADREVRALKSMSWADGVIVKLVDCWIGNDFKQANIVMELLPHSLRDVLEGRRRQNQGAPALHLSARWVAQTTVGLGAIHHGGFIHRDIKPSNLLLTEDLRRCKIADLGVSRPLCGAVRQPMHAPAPSDVQSAADGGSEIEAGSRIGTDITESSRMSGMTEASSILSGYTQRPGTQAYTSPEALRGGNYDEKLDVFALGCVLLELLTMTAVPNLKVAQGENLQERVETVLATAEIEHRKGGNQAEDEGGIGKKGVSAFLDLRNVCVDMLSTVPARRPTPAQVIEIEVFRPHCQQLFKEHPKLEVIRDKNCFGKGLSTSCIVP